jgi:ubiquinone/menaquinone biosynthesis C-methylase UbiE
MPREGELTYYQAIGEGGRQHALNKPFSDEAVGTLLMQIGAIIQLLPAPPASVLECGCGTGWLSQMLQKCGYQVVGVDVSQMAIHLARSFPLFRELDPPQYLVADAERLTFETKFDVVLFFDALHHSADEQAAINGAYRVLKCGGICIASETPSGHEANSREVVARYGVIEKDMPPSRIAKLGKVAGFRKIKVYPRADEIGKRLFCRDFQKRKWLTRMLAKIWPFNYLTVLSMMMFRKRNYGITVLSK